MYQLVIPVVTAAVFSISAMFSPGMLLTIGSGFENAVYSAGSTFKKTFADKSFIDLADVSVALFADSIVPAVVPGSTRTGRPYIVSITDLTNATILAAASFNVSDPVVLMNLVRASVHVDPSCTELVLSQLDSAEQLYAQWARTQRVSKERNSEATQYNHI
ncbi:MAG: hypothetical protein Q9166_004570 [cf. Caloplaca sp. 2 TL-2023]